MYNVNEERMIGLFKKLVETDSPSLNERGVCDILKNEFAKIGVEAREDNAGEIAGGSCGNLYAYIDGGLDLPPVLFSAHMDTVEPSANKKMIMDEDGRIHSDGTTVLGSDDLAGVSAIVEALNIIKENKLPHRPIEVLFSISEETICAGARFFDYDTAKSKEAYVFDLDGDIGTAAYAAPTILSFKAEFIGKSAHAGLAPEEGIHAIKAAALAISRIECGKLDGATVNIGTVKGGMANNIVPDYCAITGEVRSYSDSKVTEIYEQIEEIIKKSATELGADVKTEARRDVIAYETPVDHPVVKRFCKAIENMERTPVLERSFGGSDNNVFAQHGINGIVVSTAMNACHTTGEWTTKSELMKAAELALNLMLSED